MNEFITLIKKSSNWCHDKFIIFFQSQVFFANDKFVPLKIDGSEGTAYFISRIIFYIELVKDIVTISSSSRYLFFSLLSKALYC